MAPKFQGVDFYDVDGLLSEEERAVRDTVRAWVDDNLIPIIGERSEEHTSELQSQSNLVCRLLLEKKKDLPNRPSTRLNPTYSQMFFTRRCFANGCRKRR